MLLRGISAQAEQAVLMAALISQSTQASNLMIQKMQIQQDFVPGEAGAQRVSARAPTRSTSYPESRLPHSRWR